MTAPSGSLYKCPHVREGQGRREGGTGEGGREGRERERMSEGKKKLGSPKQDVEEQCYSIAFASTAGIHIQDNIFTIQILTHS